MLASPESTAEAIWGRFANESPNESAYPGRSHGIPRAPQNRLRPGGPDEQVIYVEDKFDGIRAQLHRGRGTW